MHSVIREGGTVTNYSPRFSLLFGSAARHSAIKHLPKENLNGPPRKLKLPVSSKHIELRKRQNGDPYDVPWSLQRGETRYAPMQSYPPTKITRSKPTPPYPPSKFVLATTPLPPNKIIHTTMTQVITWSFTQQENQVSRFTIVCRLC
jgi:hypothetical protein